MPSSNVASMYSPPITRSRATKIRNDTVVSLDSEAKTKLFNYLGNSLSAVKKKQSKNKIRKRSTNHEAEHDREDRAEPDASESTKAIEEQGEKRKKLKGNHYDDVQLDGAPEGELHEVAVQDSENISPLADAATELQQILDFLKQPNWKEADCWHQRFLAVETLRAAILHHPRDIEKPLSSVWGLVQEATMSLRSAIQRNGIYCVQDFISNTNIDMIPHYGLLIPLLLKSSASEKKFISTSAQKALSSGVKVNPEAVLPFLFTASEDKNIQMVDVVGQSLESCLTILLENPESTFDVTKYLNDILISAVRLLPRTTAKKSLILIRAKLGHEQFTSMVHNQLEGSDRHQVMKVSTQKKSSSSERKGMSLKERMLLSRKKTAQTSNIA